MPRQYPPNVTDWSPQDHADYEREIAAQGGPLGPLGPITEPDAPASRHVQDFVELQPEDIAEITNRLEIDANPRQTAARMRARRSHMVRKLKNRFRLFEPFSIADAAERCRMSVEEMRGFLEFEVSMPGSLFKRQGTDFVITSPWIV